jgi:hypothetical protein
VLRLVRGDWDDVENLGGVVGMGIWVGWWNREAMKKKF